MNLSRSRLRYCLWGGGMGWVQIGGEMDRWLAETRGVMEGLRRRLAERLMPTLETTARELAAVVKEHGA